MFPSDFEERIRTQKYIDSASLLKSLEEPSPVSIRINSEKWNYNPVDPEPVPWCKSGYYLAARPSYTPDPLFHSGCYYPQEASGMFLEEVIRQTSDLNQKVKVLDLCGAPGGKSTILADIIGDDSILVSNETIRSRAAVLAETVTKWGLGNTLVTQNDPAAFGRLEGYFDIVVVDAPCSGEGMFRSSIALSEWSVPNTVHCSERQKRILMNVWPALKENGILVYSTCTFNPEENEENIKWLTEKSEADCIRLNIEGFKEITEIEYKGIWGYGFYPGKSKGEGFFISVLRKKENHFSPVLKTRIKAGTGLKPTVNDLAAAAETTQFPGSRVFRWGEEVIAAPCPIDDYAHLFRNLRIVKAGTKLFTVKNNAAIPSHELALSRFLKKAAFPEKETELYDAVAYLRRDNFHLTSIDLGWNLVTYKGINLGFVKNIGNRINNYYPVEWRIRMENPISGNENIINWQIRNRIEQIP